MSLVLKNGNVFYKNRFQIKDLFIDNSGKLFIIDDVDIDADEVIDISGCHIMPSFISLYDDKQFNEGYTVSIMTNKKNGDFIISNDLGNKDAIAYLIDEHKPINTNEDLLFISDSVNDKILKMYNTLHIKKIKKEEIKFLINKVNKNLTCDVDIDELIINRDFIKYIKDKTIKCVSGKNSFCKLYTIFVKEKLLTLEEVVNLVSLNIADIFCLDNVIENFKIANICIFDLNKSYRENKNSPYIFGKCLMTISDGKVVFKDNTL